MEPSFLNQLSTLSHVGWSPSPRPDHAPSVHQKPLATRKAAAPRVTAVGISTSRQAVGTPRLPEIRLSAGTTRHYGTLTPGLASETARVLNPRQASE
ncbi:hypothetical protein PAL_GLEAN10007222 [Pteropus alecto]|uniref:Uncharacterized protein n=1 Tax=Pteropus alecto TaxID=9402 RepID=L5K8F1_PTEAL|nr:hypothetical protein PAL_GLEAN10007222 [Pteropus alecto]